MTASAPSMILVAGPYRSGTDDDPARMAANVHAMEAYALLLVHALDEVPGCADAPG